MGAKGEAYSIWMSKVVWGLSTCRRRYCGAYDVFHFHCPCLFLIPFYSYSSLWKVTCIFFILYYTISVAVLLTLLSSYLCYLVLLPKAIKICKMLQDAYHEEKVMSRGNALELDNSEKMVMFSFCSSWALLPCWPHVLDRYNSVEKH